MKDTPTNNKMNIYLLNIPFAVLGVAIAIVPLIIGMKYEARTEPDDIIPLFPRTIARRSWKSLHSS